MYKSLFMGNRVRIDKDLLVTLGTRLREVRLSQNITHEEVNEALKINIFRHEKGEVNISISTLALICKYYEISLTDILNGLKSSLRIEE